MESFDCRYIQKQANILILLLSLSFRDRASNLFPKLIKNRDRHMTLML